MELSVLRSRPLFYRRRFPILLVCDDVLSSLIPNCREGPCACSSPNPCMCVSGSILGKLQGAGSFTLFCPSKKALAKLNKQLGGTVKRPELKRLFQELLSDHVVPQVVLSQDVPAHGMQVRG